MDRWPTVVIVLVVVALAAMLIGVVVLLVKIVRIRALLKSTDVPRAGKAAFWGSILQLTLLRTATDSPSRGCP